MKERIESSQTSYQKNLRYLLKNEISEKLMQLDSLAFRYIFEKTENYSKMILKFIRTS